METKKCFKCQKDLPFDCFYKTGAGRKYLASKCKECYPNGAAGRRKRRLEGRETIADANNKLCYIELKKRSRDVKQKIQDFKLAKGCSVCGYNEVAEALEFDHLPGSEKRFNISQARDRHWDEIEQEIAKCEILCSICHRIRTVQRRKRR